MEKSLDAKNVSLPPSISFDKHRFLAVAPDSVMTNAGMPQFGKCKIVVTRPFWIAQNMLTIGDWAKIIPDSDFAPDDADIMCPVPWSKLFFCAAKLNEMMKSKKLLPIGYVVRLPTMAEFLVAVKAHKKKDIELVNLTGSGHQCLADGFNPTDIPPKLHNDKNDWYRSPQGCKYRRMYSGYTEKKYQGLIFTDGYATCVVGDEGVRLAIAPELMDTSFCHFAVHKVNDVHEFNEICYEFQKLEERGIYEFKKVNRKSLLAITDNHKLVRISLEYFEWMKNNF